MEVRALCIRLLMNVLMLLVAHVQQSYLQTADAAFRIVPTRLQFFEYESVRFTCERINVFDGWKVRNMKGFIPLCLNSTVRSTVTCTIDYVFQSDSGEYWCEGGGGERSNTVNITVTGGDVIIESPALPVTERDAVTLSCRTKETPLDLKADFYKDGLLIRSTSTGKTTIRSVSKSDEGLYKCRMSGAGESPESRLTVRMRNYNGSVKQSEDSNTQCADRTASDKVIHFSQHHYILLWVVVAIVLFLQLLVMGLLYLKKQLVLLEVQMNDPNLYAVIKKGKKKKKEAADAADNLSLDSNHSTEPQAEEDNNEVPEAGVPSLTVQAATDPPLTDQDSQYDSIQKITDEETPY